MALIFEFNIVSHDGKFWAYCRKDERLTVSAKKKSVLAALAVLRVRRCYRGHVVAQIGNPSAADADIAISAISLAEAKEALARLDAAKGA
jgi:hypothetical protein